MVEVVEDGHGASGSVEKRLYRHCSPLAFFLATRAEPAFFPVEVIQGEGVVHDTRGGRTVVQAGEVADLVGALLDQAVDQLVLIVIPAVKPVLETVRGDNSRTGCWAGQSEKSGDPLHEEVSPGDEDNRVLQPLPLPAGVDTVEEYPGIGLAPRAHVPVQDDRVGTDPCRNAEEVGEQARDRELQAGRGAGIPKNKEIHHHVLTMGAHKHIERCIGAYIASRYRSAVEVGAGDNFTAALLIRDSGRRILCTDIKSPPENPGVEFCIDDIFSPDPDRYAGCDVIYAIRPGEEMLPALIRLAGSLDVDLLVYHLGFEGFGRGGDIISCGVILHRYHRAQNPSKRVF